MLNFLVELYFIHTFDSMWNHEITTNHRILNLTDSFAVVPTLNLLKQDSKKLTGFRCWNKSLFFNMLTVLMWNFQCHLIRLFWFHTNRSRILFQLKPTFGTYNLMFLLTERSDFNLNQSFALFLSFTFRNISKRK